MINKRKKILILTHAFPYYPGEQFVEDEILYWGNQRVADVLIAPAAAKGLPRPLPEGVVLDAEQRGRVGKFSLILQSIFTVIFWREVLFIIKNYGLSINHFLAALKCVFWVLFFKRKIKNIIEKNKDIEVVYCYWNDAQSYAAVILKREGFLKKVFARAHRFDLYENKNKLNYMPLKRQLINDFDSVLSISNEGQIYMFKTYGLQSDKAIVSRLGVPIPIDFSKATEGNKLNLLSISFCTSVKRIDKIIDAISILQNKMSNFEISWTHIGDGPLFEDLKILAKKKIIGNNVRYKFAGNLKNVDVKKYFETNKVDLFLNTSESEGVPVSIMEAMSYGVPAIAPNVGGVSEIVSSEYGLLMSEIPSELEVANLIFKLRFKVKEIELRKSVKEKVILFFDAEKNYINLIDLLCSN